MWNDTTPLEDHLGVSFKGATYIYPMIQHPLPGIYPREMKISVHESLLLNSNEKIYSSFPHNRQKSGIAQRLITSTMEKVKVKSLSRFWLFVTPWTVAHQAPLSMGFSRQEFWSGLPFPSPGDLPDPGIEPRSPALQADALTSEPPGKLIMEKLYSIYVMK